ncbi:MAG: helix-hairpin-helix domain-containing protein [Bacteroidia bacterium]|nr:helix-hairpin-helix domain-containing protein [Bacteroidia bacterium]
MSKFREYFTFTRSERNGILVLLFIIVVLIVISQIADLFFKREKVDYTSFETEINEFISVSNIRQSDSMISGSYSDTIKADYFYFNPNTVSENDLQKLGFSLKLIKTFVNFRSKGGKFYDKDDVKKIYGMTDSLFVKIQPFIEIPEKKTNKFSENTRKDKSNYNNQKTSYPENKFQQKTKTAIDINNADTTVLCTLPGIGPGYAKRIVKYRDLLGGFVKKEQLLEVFGFTTEMYSKIENLVLIDQSVVKKINLNKAEWKQLIKHPYFPKDVTNKIIEYRKIQGKIQNVQEMVYNKMITQDQADKIKSYSDF